MSPESTGQVHSRLLGAPTRLDAQWVGKNTHVDDELSSTKKRDTLLSRKKHYSACKCQNLLYEAKIFEPYRSFDTGTYYLISVTHTRHPISRRSMICSRNLVGFTHLSVSCVFQRTGKSFEDQSHGLTLRFNIQSPLTLTRVLTLLVVLHARGPFPVLLLQSVLNVGLSPLSKHISQL